MLDQRDVDSLLRLNVHYEYNAANTIAAYEHVLKAAFEKCGNDVKAKALKLKQDKADLEDPQVADLPVALAFKNIIKEKQYLLAQQL